MDKRWDGIIGGIGLLGATLALAWAASAWFALQQQIAQRAGETASALEAEAAPPGTMPLRPLGANAHASMGAGAAAPAASPACAFEPILPPSSPADGAWQVDASPAPGLRARAFVAAARDATDANRLRDAEVALIAGCRLAARGAGLLSVPVADIQARLGQLYAAAAGQQLAGPVPEQAVDRARMLLQRSASAMHAVLGPQASRTRIVAQQLAALDAPGGGGALALAPSEPRESGALEEALQQTAGPAALARGGDAGMDTVGTAPSAPRARADGAAPDLAQLDDDLARLRAQARAVSSDPEGFGRRMAQAQARRTACRDSAACLHRWYAERRRELIAEF